MNRFNMPEILIAGRIYSVTIDLADDGSADGAPITIFRRVTAASFPDERAVPGSWVELAWGVWHAPGGNASGFLGDISFNIQVQAIARTFPEQHIIDYIRAQLAKRTTSPMRVARWNLED